MKTGKPRTAFGFTFQVPGVPASSKSAFFFARPKADKRAAKLTDRGFEVSAVSKVAAPATIAKGA